jgi:hypothetical protein
MAQCPLRIFANQIYVYALSPKCRTDYKYHILLVISRYMGGTVSSINYIYEEIEKR